MASKPSRTVLGDEEMSSCCFSTHWWIILLLLHWLPRLIWCFMSAFVRQHLLPSTWSSWNVSGVWVPSWWSHSGTCPQCWPQTLCSGKVLWEARHSTQLHTQNRARVLCLQEACEGLLDQCQLYLLNSGFQTFFQCDSQWELKLTSQRNVHITWLYMCK